MEDRTSISGVVLVKSFPWSSISASSLTIFFIIISNSRAGAKPRLQISHCGWILVRELEEVFLTPNTFNFRSLQFRCFDRRKTARMGYIVMKSNFQVLYRSQAASPVKMLNIDPEKGPRV